MTSSDNIRAAANAIASCDFLLVCTGAGMSADSGLPTYSQVAHNPIYDQQGIDYADLCRIQCCRDHPSLFYGFWGSCFNLYQETTPHEGYTILKKWCDRKEQQGQQQDREDGTGNELVDVARYYHYTSNVDGHLRRVGIPPDRIHEMHGTVETWMVMRIGDQSHTPPAMLSAPSPSFPVFINLDSSVRFPVDKETLELSFESVKTTLATQSIYNDEENNHFKDCWFRPKVLMFDDGLEAHSTMGLQDSSDRYQAWEGQVEQSMEGESNDSTPTLVVLEIGCGICVPSVRQECRDVIMDTARRCHQGTRIKGKRCTHIRINMENYDFDDYEASSDNTPLWSMIDTISIQGPALSTLQAIDKEMNALT